jgi:HK97 family phage major capsid protein
MDLKRKLIDLGAQRKAVLDKANDALSAKNKAEYDSLMEQVRNINGEVADVQALITEQERNVIPSAPSAAEARDMAEERAAQLRAGKEVKFSVGEVLRAVRNTDGDGTLVSGTIAQPTGAGAQVRDGLGQTSLLDLVSVQDMTGLGGWEEPYAAADPSVNVATPASAAGTARTAHDPTFAISPIKPYEVSVTSFVDRNIARLSPTAYMAKVQQMAMRALRNKIAALILKGDSEGTHVMYGMINGTNKASASIIDTVSATVATGYGKIDEQLLNSLYFQYGNSYEAGANAMLFCNKGDLKAWGKLRGTNEKGRLFTITPQPGQANRGVLGDGGMLVPYLLDPNLTAVDGTEQAASSGADKMCCVYGDPLNYLLGLFGDYTIRVDESVKSIERMYAILGDAVVGGNVVVDKGFVVAKIPKAAATN